MDYVSKKSSKITSRVGIKKLEMEWVLEKERLMTQPKMQGTKLNSKNKLWATKTKRRIKIKMQTRKKKMILKWKMTLMEICTRNKNSRKDKTGKKESHKKLTNRWERLTKRRKKRI